MHVLNSSVYKLLCVPLIICVYTPGYIQSLDWTGLFSFSTYVVNSNKCAGGRFVDLPVHLWIVNVKTLLNRYHLLIILKYCAETVSVALKYVWLPVINKKYV